MNLFRYATFRYAVQAASIAVVILLAACGGVSGRSSCLSCHGGIEHASKTHRDCVACHGGNAAAASKAEAHRGLLGTANPSDPATWEKSCGRCHPYQLDRVKSALMYTNSGMIRNIQMTWEGEDGKTYGTRGGEGYDEKGQPLRLQPVAELDNIAGDLYRKFCSLCHIGGQNSVARGATHGAGCAACHFPRGEDDRYTGGDPTVRGGANRAASHTMQGLPTNETCLRCHNRSGRIALSYMGLNDNNAAQVPTRDGKPGPRMTSGGRSLMKIVPDIHYARGMDCIDCHTSRDIMGDGYLHGNLYNQVEIRCEDCHGSATKPPTWRAIQRENEEPLRESRQYRQPVRLGARMILTAKNRPYSNVYVEGGKVLVQGKRSGKLFTSKVITGTPAHTIAGHERMECFACHSRAVPQCYGCHTDYDRSRYSRDFVKGIDTLGAFSEKEDYRMLYPFPLALNQRGKISPVTPGCQTFVTVTEADGRVSKSGYISSFKGKNQLRFAPFYAHNTSDRAVGCGDCHANPAFLGFGQHAVAQNTIEPTMLCPKNEAKPLDGFMTMANGAVKGFSAVTRENSRPLNEQEVKRVLRVNTCLVCHTKNNDPIYSKELDYRALEDALHRRLLGGTAGRVAR